jgi:hypothetical protein
LGRGRRVCAAGEGASLLPDLVQAVYLRLGGHALAHEPDRLVPTDLARLEPLVDVSVRKVQATADTDVRTPGGQDLLSSDHVGQGPQ